MFDATIEHEIAELSRRYGSPLRQDVTLSSMQVFDPLGKNDRYGEVCMVVRRRNGLLLTARKTYYPPDAFRLLTGGIHHGEPILDALLRETEEETGLEVEVRRFLAVVSYNLAQQDSAPTRPINFRSFALLLDEVGGTLGCLDPDERVAAFREVAIDELPLLAERLEQLTPEFDPEINGYWSDWGQFRAVIHRAVYTALSSTAERT
jgi:8-oxo-dGTP pyrophosphatase MutT (NUDIX family)